MKFLTKIVLLFVLIVNIGLTGKTQTIHRNDAQVVQSLRSHVRFLADDKLEGRLVGSKGEKKAMKYISAQFKANKLSPLGSSKYIQPFTLSRLKYNYNTTNLQYTLQFHPGSSRKIHQIAYQQFYPLHFSGIAKVTAPVVYVGYGIVANSTYNDYKNVGSIKNKIVIINLGYPEKSNPSKYSKYADIEAKADTAIARGAIGIIFLNDDSFNVFPPYKPYFTKASLANRKTIPIVFFPRTDGVENLSLYEVTINIDTVNQKITGHNVIGFINNNAKNTVVIGAHYDHLGYNELGGSTFNMSKVEYPRIHNGADDNASGTAAMLELSYSLSKSNFTNNNYILVGFSGEEEGLLGSSFLVKNFPIDTANLNYMINLDMVGRLDSIRNTFAISGTGTSPIWKSTLDSIKIDNLKPKYSDGGTGASDHTSFYNIHVPALHYFTGSHYDYHKPSDDEWKINYSGILSITKHIYELIGKLDTESKLLFTPTKDDSTTKMTFKVTLGIMPDYLYEGTGIKIDGVTIGKPASVAGIQRGDCLIQLGGFPVNDMNAYMNLLGKFEKGQTVKAKVIRGGSEIVIDITF